MKALVIGGTGPTGPYVVEGLLDRGYQVTILHRGSHEIEFTRPVEHLHGDPHFAETLTQALGNRTYDVVVGLYGRLRYVAEVIKGHTPRFVAVGGSGVYQMWQGASHRPEGAPIGMAEDGEVVTDSNVNKFAYMMVLSEQAVMAAHRERHYNATLLRYPMIYGPRQLAPAEWSIMRRILDGRHQIIIPDNGLAAQTRGYVENTAHALLLAVDQPQAAAGQIYNVGDERALTLRQWVTLIAQAMGSEVELVDMPFAVARPSRPYTGGPFHRILDLSKIKSQLGYRDKVAPAEGLARTVRWYLEHRPERGGELEQQLGDPFDYTAEDRIIQEYGTAVSHLVELPFAGFQYRHPYPHPRRPEGQG